MFPYVARILCIAMYFYYHVACTRTETAGMYETRVVKIPQEVPCSSN